jgi:hypothetical protein
MSSSTDAQLTAAEAEAIATAVALHHLHAAQSAGAGGPHADPLGNWAREALYTSIDKNPHRFTAWGLRNWG